MPRKPWAGGPPIVALHGDVDSAVPYESTQKATEDLKRLGVDAKLRTYEGVGHQITPQMHQDLYDLLSEAARSPPGAKRASSR
jgi:predicted esterase